MRKLIASLLVAVFVWLAVQHFRAPQIAPDALLGLWAQADGRTPAAPLRFYYFHKGGKGLYRYGQAGHNQTHSFDWSVDGNQLRLLFRKTGEKAVTKIELIGGSNARTLTLLTDPRGEGAGRYTERKSNLDAGPLGFSTAEPSDDTTVLDGRLWMDHTHYATGGSGFVMYQLSKHACPSTVGDDAHASAWRLGWYHRGDFDDWTTENLCYRSEPTSLHLLFSLRADRASTSIDIAGEKNKRVVTLGHDPRNFFGRTRLFDVGPSF